MRIETLEINDRIYWLVIEPLRIHNQDGNLIEVEGEFFCYFRLTEPTLLYYGELFRDEKGIPILFESPSDAVHFAKGNLIKRFG